MADTNLTKCSCLEVFGEDPNCPLHGTDALETRIADLEKQIANSDYAHLISVIADIRMKSGVGAKPMLSELADAIADRLTANPAQVTDALTYDWGGNTDLPVSRPDLSDFEVACKVRMLMRDQLDHEFICTLARDRIMGLSKRVAALPAAPQPKGE